VVGLGQWGRHHARIYAGLPEAELVVFEDSGHMTFVEENERYLAVVNDFLQRGDLHAGKSR